MSWSISMSRSLSSTSDIEAGGSLSNPVKAALKRWLSVLREEGAIAPLVLPPLTPHERIFKEFDAYLRSERGLAPEVPRPRSPGHSQVPAQGAPAPPRCARSTKRT